jgi:hypothetical protein
MPGGFSLEYIPLGPAGLIDSSPKFFPGGQFAPPPPRGRPAQASPDDGAFAREFPMGGNPFSRILTYAFHCHWKVWQKIQPAWRNGLHKIIPKKSGTTLDKSYFHGNKSLQWQLHVEWAGTVDCFFSSSIDESDRKFRLHWAEIAQVYTTQNQAKPLTKDVFMVINPYLL